MIFNKHLELEGKHATLSASQNAWLRYPKGKLEEVYLNQKIKEKGTRYHNLAKELICLKEKLPSKRRALNMFVNDAIDYGMTPEQPLCYHPIHAFGTADAISFKKNILRIHDLKTGEHEAKMVQLRIYAAYFCLEYGYEPFDIKEIILRIYQFGEINEEIADPNEIKAIMEHIKIDTDTLYKVDKMEE